MHLAWNVRFLISGVLMKGHSKICQQKQKAELDFEKELTKFNQQRHATAQDLQATYKKSCRFNLWRPSSKHLIAQIADAIEKYKLEVQAAQENRAISEKEIQLKAQETALKIERLKLDNAQAIARFNEDTANRIEAYVKKFSKRRSIAVFEAGVATFQAQTLLLTRRAQAEAERAALVQKEVKELGFF